MTDDTKFYLINGTALGLLPRTSLDAAARDVGIKDPHLSSKTDLVQRLMTRVNVFLAVKPKSPDNDVMVLRGKRTPDEAA